MQYYCKRCALFVGLMFCYAVLPDGVIACRETEEAKEHGRGG